MTLRDVPPSEWKTFVDRFSREHAAWIGSLHGCVAGAPVTRIPSVALKSVGLERDASGVVLRITFVNGVSLCAAQPRVVRIQTDGGAQRALEIETADRGFIRLAFRASALPEQLDGFAAGEWIAAAGEARRRVRAEETSVTELVVPRESVHSGC